MEEFTDQEIIDSLRNRKDYVVRHLSDKYLPMIRLMVYKQGGTPDDAKDVFQDGLIIMIEKIDTEDFVLTCKFKTFFYCVCENLWKKVIEKRKAAANYFHRKLDDSNDEDFTELIDNGIYENIIFDVFSTLDPVCQEMLKLYWQEYSPKEIAEKLGYTYGYVRKKKCDCQSELITKIKNHPDYKLLKRDDKRDKIEVSNHNLSF